METDEDKPQTKPLWLRVSVAEHDHIRAMADYERRDMVNMVRLALNQYFQQQGYDPLPKPPLRRRGRPPSP